MRDKIHEFKKATRKTVFSLYIIQIVSLLSYYMLYYFIVLFIDVETADNSLWVQLLLSILTELIICCTSYKRIWKLGDLHSADVTTGNTTIKRKAGLKVGLIATAPIYVCGFISSLLKLISTDSLFFIDIRTVFEYITALFVYRWDHVLKFIIENINSSPVFGLFFYFITCIPLVLTSVIAFKNGFCGLHENLLPKKHHSPVVGNEKGIVAWKDI